MQRMIRQFAAEYTSKTSSTQDSSHPNSTKNQSLPKSPSGKSSPPPATTQNPVLSKLLMADQDSPLDLTVKKSPSEEPCEQADGVLDLSTKKSPCSGSTSSSISQSTSNTIGNGVCHTGKKATDGANSTAVTLKKFMVKLCAHHQEQFAQVLNSLCTEEQFTLSEKYTRISDDQSNGCTCFEAKAKALPLLDSQASTATPQDHVITKAEANCANEIHHHGQLVDCSTGLFPRSPIPEDTSDEDCMTPTNYSVVSKIVYSKEDGKQSITSDEDPSPCLEDCPAVSREKGININAKVQGSAPCADALRDQEHLLDPLDCDIIDPHGGPSHSIDASKAADDLKESVASTIVPFQNQEKGLVPAAQNTFVQETRQCLTSTAPFVVNCEEPSGAFTIVQPIHEFCTDVLIPKCESVSKASVEVVSIAQLEETNLERKPSKPSLESCTEYNAHTIISGTSTHCPLSYAVNNTANGHNEMVIKPSNGLDVENKDVFSSEVHVHEDGTADPPVNALFGVELVSCKTEPVSPSMDVDLNLFVETRSMISVCDTATNEFHYEQSPLRIPTEKPLASENSFIRLPSHFLHTNGIYEQEVHCPICQSNLKESDTRVHTETCIVVQNLKTEDVEMTISSLGDINTNDYPGGNSSEISKPKCTQALKPLHDQLNCNSTHSVNRATSEVIKVNPRTRTCIEGFHAETPTENNLHSCPLETDINYVLVKPDSLAPQQEMLKCTKQFDNSEGNCVISSIKENLNLQVNYVEAGLDKSSEIGKNAPSNQTEKLNRSTFVALDHEPVENFPVACIKVEENITFINQVFDCSEYKKSPNIQKYARTKKFSTLIPSDRRLRSQVFKEPPTLIPQARAPKCIGNKNVNVVAYGETADSLSSCEDIKNVLRIRKALGNTKSASDESNSHQSSNSMHTKNKSVVSKALFIKKEDDEPLEKTGCQERKYYLSLRNRHCVPDVLSKDICHNASILETSNFNQEAQNKYISRKTLITRKHTCSKPANKHKPLASENYNLRTSMAHTKPKRVTKTANCIKIASIKSEETFGGLELSSPANETRRPKFVDWCSEEDNQELISSFSSKYMSVHKTWIPLEKEGTVTHKAKNKADKLKEIWKTKKRTRKNRSGLEAPKYSSIQSLFMNSVQFSDICQWFVETTETKSLVIVKKQNTRLPGDLTLPSFPLHKYPASSLYPHMLQAQRLKKYLKKFASVTPAHNNQKLQTTLAKLKESGDLNLHENLNDNDIVQGANACRAGKSKGNVSKPVTDQILLKYNNCKGMSHLISALVKPEKKEHPINAMETKISCGNASTRMSFSRSASEVGTNLRSPGSLTTEKRHRGRKRPKDSSGKPETQVVKKKRMKAHTSTRNNLMLKNGNKKAGSKSQGLKKQPPKHATSKTHQISAWKKRPMNRENSSKRAQVVKKHKMKTRQSKSAKQKLSTKPFITKIVKKALRAQRTRPRQKSTSGPAKYKKRVKHQRKTRKTRSKTDCPTRIKRRSLEVK